MVLHDVKVLVNQCFIIKYSMNAENCVVSDKKWGVLWSWVLGFGFWVFVLGRNYPF